MAEQDFHSWHEYMCLVGTYCQKIKKFELIGHVQLELNFGLAGTSFDPDRDQAAEQPCNSSTEQRFRSWLQL
jgi:hypothetical protein